MTSNDFATVDQGLERTMSLTILARTRVQIILDELRNTDTTRTPNYCTTRQVKEILKALSLSSCQSVLEDDCIPRSMLLQYVYSMSTIEALHNVHLGIFKQMKNCFVSYIYSDNFIATTGYRENSVVHEKLHSRWLQHHSECHATELCHTWGSV